jgi:hypothetical protein
MEREIESIRTRLDRSLAEMDRRRHELLDLKLQAHRHPAALWGAGGALLLLLGGGIALALWLSRRRDQLPAKARRFRLAVRRAVDKPDLVARGKGPVWESILASAGGTLAAALTKKALARVWAQPHM